jgi:hypothetical protein
MHVSLQLLASWHDTDLHMSRQAPVLLLQRTASVLHLYCMLYFGAKAM